MKEVLMKIILLTVVVGLFGIGGSLWCGDGSPFCLAVIVAIPIIFEPLDTLFGINDELD